jgi:hypothetical protein
MGRYNEFKTAKGRHTVRPPNLNFTKKKETKEYTEYTVKTNKDSKKKRDNESVFENALDSVIYCTPEITIKMPKENFMKTSEGKNKFAYVCLMFPAPKTKLASYTDGCILAALGLRRQKVQADIICLVTPDISNKVKLRLASVFDDVITVPYITPFKMTEDDIIINKDILKNCSNYTSMHPYSHVFTKLHIFNPDICPYEKVVFVDSDLVPMNFYDSLFTLNTPAGWVEYRKKYPFIEAWNWDRCDALEHGKPIPKYMTDVDEKTGADVNAGLMVISPNKREYNGMIKQLQSPLKEWFGKDKEHVGFYDMDFDSPIGRKFVDKSYCYPEQNYLTKRYSGKWTFVSWSFQSWSLDPCNSFGIHMAAFNPKPWFKQPAGLAVKSRPIIQYQNEEEEEEPEDNVPLIIDDNDSTLFYENITYAYEMFNEVMIWGFVNYEELQSFFLENLKIYGTKISFGADNFRDLGPKDKVPFLPLKDITKDNKYYKKLSKSQKHLSNLLNEYNKTVKRLRYNYPNSCVSTFKDTKEGKDILIVDYQIYKKPVKEIKSKSKSKSRKFTKKKNSSKSSKSRKTRSKSRSK